MKTDRYINYFSNHYKYHFRDEDLSSYRKWFYRQWKIINKKIKFDKNKKILEIGSAIGGFFSFFKGEKYLGLELDGAAVEFANKHFKTDKFLCKSFDDFRSNQKYDYIFAFEVLEHLDNPRASIAGIYDLLQEGAYFIGTTPFPFLKNVLPDPTHLFVLHPRGWERLFKEAGFKEIKLYPMSFVPFLWRISNALNIRLPFYVPFKYFVSTCLIIAKK